MGGVAGSAASTLPSTLQYAGRAFLSAGTAVAEVTTAPFVGNAIAAAGTDTFSIWEHSRAAVAAERGLAQPDNVPKAATPMHVLARSTICRVMVPAIS